MKRILYSVLAMGLLLAVVLRVKVAADGNAIETSEYVGHRYVPTGDSAVLGQEEFDVAPQVTNSPLDVIAQLPTAAFPSSASAPDGTARRTTVPRTVIVYEPRQVQVQVDAGTPRQQQYAELMLKRAQRMSDEELTTAIETVEAELKQQDDAADAELQKAIEILNKLKQASSGTPAARKAEQAIPILDGTLPQSVHEGTAPFSDGSTPASEPFGAPATHLPTY